MRTLSNVHQLSTRGQSQRMIGTQTVRPAPEFDERHSGAGAPSWRLPGARVATVQPLRSVKLYQFPESSLITASTP